jgi:hypothetical protein
MVLEQVYVFMAEEIITVQNIMVKIITGCYAL